MNKLLVILVLLVVTISSCKDKDSISENGNGISNAAKANLYNKVWTSTSSAGGIDLEFLSDGTFRQALSLEGTWKWQNGRDTMNITDHSNKKFNYLFDEITNSQIKFRTNLGGDNYKTVSTYKLK